MEVHDENEASAPEDGVQHHDWTTTKAVPGPTYCWTCARCSATTGPIDSPADLIAKIDSMDEYGCPAYPTAELRQMILNPIATKE